MTKDLRREALVPLRDGAETFPEFEDFTPGKQTAARSSLEQLLDEALLESFPASDPPASGRMS